MKWTKEQVEKAKAEHKARLESKPVRKTRAKVKEGRGRPKRTQSVERLTVYMPEQVAESMRVRVKVKRETVSNYLTRLVETDLRKGEL